MGFLDEILGGQNASPLQGALLSILSSQAGAGTQGGGLGGLAGLLGGGAGGGLQSLVSAFEQQGMGDIAQSWVGHGANQPVSPDQLQSVFGDDRIQSMADQTGMAPEDLLSELSRLLPGVIDHLTPGGQVPSGA